MKNICLAASTHQFRILEVVLCAERRSRTLEYYGCILTKRGYEQRASRERKHAYLEEILRILLHEEFLFLQQDMSIKPSAPAINYTLVFKAAYYLATASDNVPDLLIHWDYSYLDLGCQAPRKE